MHSGNSKYGYKTHFKHLKLILNITYSLRQRKKTTHRRDTFVFTAYIEVNSDGTEDGEGEEVRAGQRTQVRQGMLVREEGPSTTASIRLACAHVCRGFSIQRALGLVPGR